MNAPKISVVVPFHNDEETLRETLDSMFNQSLKEWECLLVDDTSIDTSLSVAQTYSKLDKRFVVYQSDAFGANRARNIGLQKSNSNWLVFLDADDVVHGDCLEERLDYLEQNPDTEMLISGTYPFNKIAGDLKTAFTYQDMDIDQLIYDFLVHKIRWTTTGPTWNKEFLNKIGGWNESYPRLQDIELNIRALKHYPKIKSSNKIDSYRRNSAFSDTKRENALIGFDLLINNYYKQLVHENSNPEKAKFFQEAFEEINRFKKSLLAQS